MERTDALAFAGVRPHVMNEQINNLIDQLATARAERDALRSAIGNPTWVFMGHECAKVYIARARWDQLMGISPATEERSHAPCA